MDHKVDFLKKRDVKSFFNLLDHAFPSDSHFNETWAHTCNSLPENFKNHLIIRDKGRVVSHVGVHPMMIKLNGSVLKAAGIGAVSTLEKYRGRGFMQALLKASIDLMKKKKYDISWLGGDRKRYGFFGWENGGRSQGFGMTNRILKDLKMQSYKVKKYNGENKLLKEIKSIHDMENFGLSRSNTGYKLLLGELKKEIYIAYDNNKAVSYIIIGIAKKNNKSAVTARTFEYGGDVNGLKYLFKYIFEVLKCENLNISVPVFYNKYKKLLFEICSNWSVNLGGMIKIIDLKSILKKFEKQMSLKTRKLNMKASRTITLEIPELNQSATLKIGNDVKVIHKPSTDKLVLDQRKMIRLLFGLTKPSDSFLLGKEFLILDAVFPLDFYFFQSESV